MIGKQINFYFMPEDWKELDQFLLEKEFLILSAPMPSSELCFLQSTQEPSKEIFISSKNLLSSIQIIYIEKQKYYMPDLFTSPLIELSIGKEGIVKGRSRLYYVKGTDPIFQKTADELFKWIKKHFKNMKLAGLEEFLITEKTKAWLESSPEHKLADSLEFRKQQKQRVA